MTLLLRPQFLPGEGPRGYLVRLAEANGLCTADLKGLGIIFDKRLLSAGGYFGEGPAECEHACRIQTSLDAYPMAWNQLTSRYCPLCLSEDGIWQFGWELYWCDACAKHKVWLIDRCMSCGDRLTWNRSRLGRCPCGLFIARTRPAACPDSVALLSALLSARALGEEGRHPFAPLNRLSLGQIQRLIRLFGAYGDGGWQPKPQKIFRADWMDVSWQLTSLAAEYLANGVNGVFEFMKNLYLKSEALSEGQGRMRGRFGHFYSLLYRAFSEPEFHFLRSTFEGFVAEHWQGAIGRRNRNLPSELLGNLVWIPATEACRQLKISRQTLHTLVSNERIAAVERIGSKGRRFFMFRRADVDVEMTLRGNYVDQDAAATLLGLKKCRIAKILPWFIPESTKGLAGWQIPREKLELLSMLGNDLHPVIDQDADSVCLNYMLRHWSWHDRMIAKLFDAMLNGAIRPTGKRPERKGIAGLIFRKSDLEIWCQSVVPKNTTSISIPEAAQLLQIKQEVAYRLVSRGFLPSSKEKLGRRTVTRVSRNSLDEFRDSYVFGRDLAEEMGTSPRALADRLDRLDIRPVSGPSTDGGRQYIFARNIGLATAMDAIRFVSARGSASRASC